MSFVDDKLLRLCGTTHCSHFLTQVIARLALHVKARELIVATGVLRNVISLMRTQTASQSRTVLICFVETSGTFIAV